MAAYVSVPRDLTRVKSKILFNLTKRQLLCFGVGILIGIPAYFGLKRVGNVSLATLGMIIIMLPMFLLAMYEKDGQPLEVIAFHFIQAKFIRPKVRPYQTDCYYAALERQFYVYEESRAIYSRAEARTISRTKCGMPPGEGRGHRSCSEFASPASKNNAGHNKEVDAIECKKESGCTGASKTSRAARKTDAQRAKADKKRH